MEHGLVLFVVDLGVNDSGSRERERERGGERDDLASLVFGLGLRVWGLDFWGSGCWMSLLLRSGLHRPDVE